MYYFYIESNESSCSNNCYVKNTLEAVFLI